jgi:hypothetical protein
MKSKYVVGIIILMIIISGYIMADSKNDNKNKKYINDDDPKNKTVIIPPDIRILQPEIPIYIGNNGLVIYDDIEECILQIENRSTFVMEPRYFHYFVYDKSGLIIYDEGVLSESVILPINITIPLSGNPPYFLQAKGQTRITFYLWGDMKNVNYDILKEIDVKTTNITLFAEEGKTDIHNLKLNEEVIQWNFLGINKEETDYIGNFSIIDPNGRSQVWGLHGVDKNVIYLQNGARYLIHGNWTIKLEVFEGVGKFSFPFYTHEISKETWEKHGFNLII